MVLQEERSMTDFKLYPLPEAAEEALKAQAVPTGVDGVSIVGGLTEVSYEGRNPTHDDEPRASPAILQLDEKSFELHMLMFALYDHHTGTTIFIDARHLDSRT